VSSSHHARPAGGDLRLADAAIRVLAARVAEHRFVTATASSA
jgi:hypothetical protein